MWLFFLLNCCDRQWISLGSLSRVLLCFVYSSARFLFALQLHRFIACFIVFAQHLHCFLFFFRTAALLFFSPFFYFMLLPASGKRALGFPPSVSAYRCWRSCTAFFCLCAKHHFNWESVVPSGGSRSSQVYHATSSIVSILRGGGGDFPT